MTWDEMLITARSNNITVKVSKYKYSKKYEKNKIMGQTPASGETISGSNAVELSVSLGYAQVEVPDVVLLDEEKATTQLENKGLIVTVSYKNDETVAKGLVISQSIQADTKVDPETVIEIVVSKGAAEFEMPSVIGETENDAYSTLNGKGLAVSISYEQNDSKPEGTVIKQTPSKGA